MILFRDTFRLLKSLKLFFNNCDIIHTNCDIIQVMCDIIHVMFDTIQLWCDIIVVCCELYHIFFKNLYYSGNSCIMWCYCDIFSGVCINHVDINQVKCDINRV